MRYQLIGQISRAFSQLAAATLFATAQVQAQDQTPASPPPEYDFSAERGPHHRRVETTVTVPDADGNPVEKPTRYIELATGLNYLEDGLWKQSEEKIEPHPRGAAALKGYYKAIFGKNLNRAGAIELTLPDGQKQKNHPLGLYYYDRGDGKWVKLSGMKDSDGVIIPPNRVLYRDAFDSIRGDLLYTYEKGRFEADVIVRERLAAPDTFGLSNETTMLEMATEFTETSEPKKTQRLVKKEENQAKRAAMVQPDISDEFLDFGSSQMIPGTAFPLEAGTKRPIDLSKHVSVSKRWQKRGSRNILSEQVEYSAIGAMLAQLVAGTPKGQTTETVDRSWPEARANDATPIPMETGILADAPGVVLDYSTLPGDSFSGTFSGTYYIADNFTWSGSATFSSPYVKFAAGKSLTLYGSASGSGALMTAKDDNSSGSGEIISGSTGSPNGAYATIALLLNGSPSASLSGFTIKFATVAAWMIPASGNSHSLSGFQIQNSSTAFNNGGSGTVTVTNPNFCGVGTQYSGASISHSGDTTCSNTAPTMPNITDSTIARNSSLGVAFTIGDSQTPEALVVTASSSNTSLVPNGNLSLSGGSATSRSLSVTPLSNTSGQTTITVTVSDGFLTASDTFVLTVNDPPAIPSISNRSTLVDQTGSLIAFVVTDPDLTSGNIVVTATSSNSSVVQSSNAVIGPASAASGTVRTLTITPNAGAYGTANISVQATDSNGSGASSTQTFLFTVKQNYNDPDQFPSPLTTPGSPPGPANAQGGGPEPTADLSGGCPPIDLTKIKKLEVTVPDTCQRPGETQDKSVTTKLPGCSACQYKLKVTVTFRAPSYADAVGKVEVCGEVVNGTSTPGVPIGCNMVPTTKTVYVTLNGGDDFELKYLNSGWSHFTGITDGWAKIDDVQIVSPDEQQNCPTCTNDGFGTSQEDVGCVSMSFGAGSTAFGNQATTLRVYEESPCPELATPKCLSVVGQGADVNVIRDSASQVRQVRTPQGLVDVITDSAYQYTLKFYTPSMLGNGGNPLNGLYVLNGTPTPIGSFAISNPNGAANCNSLRVLETRAGATYQCDYVYVPVGGNPAKWELTVPNNTFKEQKEYQTINSSERSETRTVSNPSASQTAKKTKQTFTNFTFGEMITETKLSPDSNPRTSTYTYYTDTANNGYGQLQRTLLPDGRWQWVEYDSQKRVWKIYSGFNNYVPTDWSIAPAASQSRVIEYLYIPVSSEDTGAFRPQLPRTEIVKVKGNELGRKYYVYKRSEMQEIVCTVANATWDATSNLKTITKRVETGVFKDELLSVENPDGTMSIYSYASDATTKTVTITSGKPNTGKTAIDDGTCTETVTRKSGQVQSRSVYPVIGGAINYSVYLSRELYGGWDDQDRATVVDYLDGTRETMAYGCCGLETKIDRDGVQTTYEYYPETKHLKSEKRYDSPTTFITTSYEYDAAGRMTKVKRKGSNTNDPEKVQRTYTYDQAGQLLEEFDALNVKTKYEEVFDSQTGQTTRTTTYAHGTADAATRIETFDRDGSLIKVTGTAVNPVKYEYGVEQDASTWRLFHKEIKLDANGNEPVPSEWSKTYTDMAGRDYKTVHAAASGTPTSLSEFYPAGQAGAGQPKRQVDPDNVATLYKYNDKGELEETVVDYNLNAAIDYALTDRITRSVRSVVNNVTYGTWVNQILTTVYTTDNSTATLDIAKIETAVDGKKIWSTVRSQTGLNLTTLTETQYTPATGGPRTETTTSPDNTKTVKSFSQGRLTMVQQKDSNNNVITQTTYAYDTLGRVSSPTDLRNGTTSYTYDDLDRVLTVTTPAPGNGQPGQITSTQYDNLSRVKQVTHADGAILYNEYYLNGLLKKTYGSRTYPVEYTYDAQGRMKTMKTWQNYAGNSGTATTTWNYDLYRGWLLTKRDNSSQGCDYTYKPSGRLLTRKWARGTTSSLFTTYSYNNAGELSLSDYTDTSTDVSCSYDRRGRKITAVQGAMTTTYAYSDANFLTSESYTGGTLGGLSVNYTADTYLRRSQVEAKNGGTSLAKTTYTYDSASGRLTQVSDGGSPTAYSASYSYLANSPLISQIDLKQNTTLRMSTVKNYDYLSRLSSIASHPGGTPSLASVTYSYQYNQANQRVRMTLADASYWLYFYDSLGQVVSAKRYWPDHTPVAGQQAEYGFDDIGNRTTTKVGGDSSGANLRSATYSPNTLNQYASRGIPGAVDILGIANAGASATVNGYAAYRKGEYFDYALSVGNASAAVWQAITASAGGTPQTGNVFVLKTPESYTYDLDGNTTGDGRWNYTPDAENRLIRLVANNTSPAVGPQQRIDFEYDHQGRRVSKKVWNNTAGTGTPALSLKFLYDGWNLQAELDGNNNNEVVRTYVWGLDIGGGVQGAGGVGGLISMKPAGGTAHFAAYDGNGNLVALVDGSAAALSANYEYSAFGETIRATGTQAKANPLRFSTKYTDDETDFCYYGYRYYNPSTGRWLNRDPIEEEGGVNLYGFVGNNAITRVDILGLTFEYRSVGKSSRDPCYYSSWSSNDSGSRNTPTAWYNQSVVSLPGSVALCNSREGLDIQSSRVEGYVKWKGNCCVKAKFTCAFSYQGFVYEFGVIGTEQRAISVIGSLLDYSVDRKFMSRISGTALYVVANTSQVTSQTIDLQPDREFKLYYLYSNIAFSLYNANTEKIWGGFRESMTATCSGKVVGKCSE